METGQIFPAGRLDKKSPQLSEGSEQWLLTMGLQKNRRGQTQFQKGTMTAGTWLQALTQFQNAKPTLGFKEAAAACFSAW